MFIYHFEGIAPFADPASTVLRQLEQGRSTGVTSVISLSELVVHPLQNGQRELAASLVQLVRVLPGLDIVDIDSSIAWQAAELRAVHPLRTPDALQVAACIEHGATAFVTNDRRLRRLTEIEVILLGDLLGL